MNFGLKPQRRLVAFTVSLSVGVTLAAAGCAATRTSARPAAAASTASAAASTEAAGTASSSSTPITDPVVPAADRSTGPAPGPAARTMSAPPAATTPASGSGPMAAPKRPAQPPPPPVPASSLPNAAAAVWQPMGGLVAMNVPAARDIGIGECVGVNGAAAWHEQGYVSAQNTPAQEDVFGFADTATATKAFDDIVAGLGSCAATSRDLQRKAGTALDATVATTATANRAQAWSRQWTAVPGQSAAGPQRNHYYLVQHGATVIVASFTEFGADPANPYDTAGDPAVLTMLAANAGS